MIEFLTVARGQPTDHVLRMPTIPGITRADVNTLHGRLATPLSWRRLVRPRCPSIQRKPTPMEQIGRFSPSSTRTRPIFVSFTLPPFVQI
ncbi:hypothetical protein NKR19_g2851 [Coniochaeta hoffmannii]|uniref:Uncharacterized protein n=1 Tax=Coniochaeta hoffmannii TaxID=91930 RepID=A0AA38VZH2_9PEZI|nr:hypothetical protein NKR19_g2851 [Coniochaeta hoffmannii]